MSSTASWYTDRVVASMDDVGSALSSIYNQQAKTWLSSGCEQHCHILHPQRAMAQAAGGAARTGATQDSLCTLLPSTGAGPGQAALHRCVPASAPPLVMYCPAEPRSPYRPPPSLLSSACRIAPCSMELQGGAGEASPCCPAYRDISTSAQLLCIGGPPRRGQQDLAAALRT